VQPDVGDYLKSRAAAVDVVNKAAVCVCEQLQDVIEREHYPSSSSSRDQDLDRSPGPHPQSDGFSVRGAPWSNIMAPDTNSMDDFPDLSQVIKSDTDFFSHVSLKRERTDVRLAVTLHKRLGCYFVLTVKLFLL